MAFNYVMKELEKVNKGKIFNSSLLLIDRKDNYFLKEVVTMVNIAY